MARDTEVTATLESAGWRVYRVFESRLTDDPTEVVAEIETLVRERQRSRTLEQNNATTSVTGRRRAKIS
jgi:DNA mismatch endonuclease (patch repair protein)